MVAGERAAQASSFSLVMPTGRLGSGGEHVFVFLSNFLCPCTSLADLLHASYIGIQPVNLRVLIGLYSASGWLAGSTGWPAKGAPAHRPMSHGRPSA